jgi:hypothetical protein
MHRVRCSWKSLISDLRRRYLFLFLLVGDIQLSEAAWGGGIHRCNDLRDMWLDEGSSPLTQHHDGNLTASEVLLIT